MIICNQFQWNSQSFANQCSLINNKSKLPLNRASTATSFLSSVNINESDILNILKSLDNNKAHGYDDTSIRMFKLSYKSTLKPLKLLFADYLPIGILLEQWKKANIVLIHKKCDKQLIKNQRPVFLLPICGKVFERIIINDLFKYFLSISQVLSREICVSNNL